MQTYRDCKKFEGIIYTRTLWAKINRDGSRENKKKKKKWIGERETPTVCELRNDTLIHTTSEWVSVWFWWWELGCCFYLSTVFHATMPLLLYSFWFPFYFGFIMCSAGCVQYTLCTAGRKLWVPFELQLSLFLT